MLGCDRIDEAESYLRAAEAHIVNTGEQMYRAPVLTLSACISFRKGEDQELVRRDLEESIRVAVEQGAALFELNALIASEFLLEDVRTSRFEDRLDDPSSLPGLMSQWKALASLLGRASY